MRLALYVTTLYTVYFPMYITKTILALFQVMCRSFKLHLKKIMKTN